MPRRPKKGARCSSACPTRDHLTFGECLRAKNINLNPHLADTNVQKDWDNELKAYRSAVDQGIQPAGTKMHQIREAVEASQASGVAYDATAGASAF